MAELPHRSYSEPVNGRLWLSDAVAAGTFSIPNEWVKAEPPAAELDGEPINFGALMWAVIIALGSGDGRDDVLPEYLPRRDYERARSVLRELGAPR